MEQTFVEWDIFLQSKLSNMTEAQRIEWGKSHVITHGDKKLVFDFASGNVVDYKEGAELLN